jgi:hypothetical protein
MMKRCVAISQKQIFKSSKAMLRNTQVEEALPQIVKRPRATNFLQLWRVKQQRCIYTGEMSLPKTQATGTHWHWLRRRIGLIIFTLSLSLSLRVKTNAAQATVARDY